jgi:opacity protein-like surface antigen
MKNFLIISTIFATLMTAAVTQAPTAAVAGGIGNNYVAPAVTFGGGQTVFGIDSKLGIADNISLRPYVTFPTGGTQFGTSLTYDWDLRQSPASITPFVGLGLGFQTGNVSNTTTTVGFAQVGADFNVSDSIALLGSVAIPFSSNNASTSVTLGAGFRF